MASIYQKKALEKLDSPEELDKLISVTPPMTWMIITGAGLMISVFLIWAFFGNIRQIKQVDGVSLGGGNGRIAAFIPVDMAGEIKEGTPCEFSVVIGEHMGNRASGTIKKIDKRTASAENFNGIITNGEAVEALLRDRAMITAYIEPLGEDRLESGEIIEVHITVLDIHPYELFLSGNL